MKARMNKIDHVFHKDIINNNSNSAAAADHN